MYAGFGQADYQTLPEGTEVLVPAGTPLFVQLAADAVDVTDTPVEVERRRAVVQDTFVLRLPEPVDVLYEEEAAVTPAPAMPTVVVQAPAVSKESETEEPWYKTPAFVGGVLSVLAFSAIAFLQSRAQEKIK